MRKFTVSPSMVVAMVAVVLSVTGTAVAARFITGKQIKDGSISAKDLSKAVRKELARTGATGPRGAAGVVGATGAKGDAGPAGTLIVARPVLAAAKATAGKDAATALPMADNSWTQAAGETDLIIGETDVTVPFTCDTPSGDVDIFTHVAGIEGQDGPSAFEHWNLLPKALLKTGLPVRGISGSMFAISPPAVATPRTLTAQASDPCGDTDTNINGLRLTVIAIR